MTPKARIPERRRGGLPSQVRTLHRINPDFARPRRDCARGYGTWAGRSFYRSTPAAIASSLRSRSLRSAISIRDPEFGTHLSFGAGAWREATFSRLSWIQSRPPRSWTWLTLSSALSGADVAVAGAGRKTIIEDRKSD